MSTAADCNYRRRSSYYGAFAFGTVVLTGYANFLTENWYYTSAKWVPVVFLFGAVYVTLGILSGAYDELRHRKAAPYYVVQCALLTAIVFLSPVRGFIAIVVLPVVSQAIFDLRLRVSALIGAYLFAVAIAVWAIPYGFHGLAQAAMNYATAFVFTMAFSLMSKQALVARERESKLRQQVEAANEQLREYAAQAEELATTRERNRIAREIHDGVGHYLTVIKTQLDAAGALLPAQPDRARDAVTTAARLSGDALDDVRRSVGALRTDVRRPPLTEALRTLTQDAGLPVAVQVVGAARSLPPAVEHALYRSAQEGLTNIRKHAAASSAELVLDFRSPHRVRLALSDDGRGAGDAPARGFGLMGIRERVEVLGGQVEVGNRREGGFALSVEVPA